MLSCGLTPTGYWPPSKSGFSESRSEPSRERHFRRAESILIALRPCAAANPRLIEYLSRIGFFCILFQVVLAQGASHGSADRNISLH
jgi:hypothetical protein